MVSALDSNPGQGDCVVFLDSLYKNVAVGRINRMAALTGFNYKKMYGRFTGTKKSGHKAVLHCTFFPIENYIQAAGMTVT